MANATLTSFNPDFVPAYSDSVYLVGVRRLTTRDGYKGIPSVYVIPCMTYAANNYLDWQFTNAITQGFITEDEYIQTMTYKTTT